MNVTGLNRRTGEAGNVGERWGRACVQRLKSSVALVEVSPYHVCPSEEFVHYPNRPRAGNPFYAKSRELGWNPASGSEEGEEKSRMQVASAFSDVPCLALNQFNETSSIPNNTSAT